VGGVAEALSLLGRSVHELENRMAKLESRPEISGEYPVAVRPAPRAPEVAEASVLLPPAAVPLHAQDMEVPWNGTGRRRKVLVIFTLLLLLGFGSLAAALAYSYGSP
jgi:hypothetical protein